MTAEQAVAARKIKTWNDVTNMNWSEFRPFSALACLPAIILLIACAQHWLRLGSAGRGVWSVPTGLSSLHRADARSLPRDELLCGRRGTLAHASLPLDLTCVALWGFGFGLMNMVGRGPGWLALQGSTALVIAAAFPASPVFAARRSLLVLAGGAVQFIVVLAIHWLAPARLIAPAANASVTVGSILSQVRAMMEGRARDLRTHSLWRWL